MPHSWSLTDIYILNYNTHVFLPVGGIYTVIKTKAAVTAREYGDQYVLLGPYNAACVRGEVEEMDPEGPIRYAIYHMRDHGIKVHV